MEARRVSSELPKKFIRRLKYKNGSSKKRSFKQMARNRLL